MKTFEQGSNVFTTWLGNATALPTEWIIPLFSICPQIIALGRRETQSLFYNSVIYLRAMLPFWIGIQIRWAGNNPAAKEYFQCGIGWKLNGRLALIFRIQSDNASARGVSGPNSEQAHGWDYGTK